MFDFAFLLTLFTLKAIHSNFSFENSISLLKIYNLKLGIILIDTQEGDLDWSDLRGQISILVREPKRALGSMSLARYFFLNPVYNSLWNN